MVFIGIISVDRNKMRVKKGHLRLSPNEEAQLIKEETEKRRKLRIKQVLFEETKCFISDVR